MGMTCTSCHNSIDTSDTSASRRRHVTNPTAGTIQQNYRTKFNLDNIPIQASDTGSVYGNPLWGVCFQCHASYEAHRTKTAGLNLGCQDCHDEHAENSGAGSNVFMIPLTAKPQGTYNTTYNGGTPIRAKAGAEAILYDTPRINPATGRRQPECRLLRRRRASGICDSTECHGAKGYTPAATFLASGNHSGGSSLRPATTARTTATRTGRPGGAWRASTPAEQHRRLPRHGRHDRPAERHGLPGPRRQARGAHRPHRRPERAATARPTPRPATGATRTARTAATR